MAKHHLATGFDAEADHARGAAPATHQGVVLASCAVLDLPAAGRKDLREKMNALVQAHVRGDAQLVVPQTQIVPRAPGADAINRPFLEALVAVVAAHNQAPRHEFRQPVFLMLHLLYDCAKTSPVQSVCHERNAGAVHSALGRLAALAAMQPTPLDALCNLTHSLDIANLLPCRFLSIIKGLLRSDISAADLQQKLLCSALNFFSALCSRVLDLGRNITSSLDDYCTACCGADDPARIFLVAFRVVPSAGADTLLPIHAQEPLLHLLERECVTRDPRIRPTVIPYGEYVLARGNWAGEDGHAAARQFGRAGLQIIYSHNVIPDGGLELDVDVPEEGIAALYQASVLFDNLDARVNNLDSEGMFFGHGPFRPPDCSFAGKSADLAGAERCRKINKLGRTCRLGPGLVTFSCTHRVVYGIVVMREFESPRMLFQVFRQYFVWPPRIVVYDLGCVLAKYALARNPSVFSGTVFALDKFHEVRGMQ